MKKGEEKEQSARIISVEDLIMAVTEQHKEVTLEELLLRGFEAAYEIDSKKRLLKKAMPHLPLSKQPMRNHSFISSWIYSIDT